MYTAESAGLIFCLICVALIIFAAITNGKGDGK